MICINMIIETGNIQVLLKLSHYVKIITVLLGLFLFCFVFKAMNNKLTYLGFLILVSVLLHF